MCIYTHMSTFLFIYTHACVCVCVWPGADVLESMALNDVWRAEDLAAVLGRGYTRVCVCMCVCVCMMLVFM
jgi:hypothetical protein